MSVYNVFGTINPFEEYCTAMCRALIRKPKETKKLFKTFVVTVIYYLI